MIKKRISPVKPDTGKNKTKMVHLQQYFSQNLESMIQKTPHYLMFVVVVLCCYWSFYFIFKTCNKPVLIFLL